MTNFEKAKSNAFKNGVVCAQAHLGQIASRGVSFELRSPYSRKSLKDAWQNGVNSIIDQA